MILSGVVTFVKGDDVELLDGDDVCPNYVDNNLACGHNYLIVIEFRMPFVLLPVVHLKIARVNSRF